MTGPRAPQKPQKNLPVLRSSLVDGLLLANTAASALVVAATAFAASRSRGNLLDYLILAMSAYAGYTFLMAYRAKPDELVRPAWPATRGYAITVGVFAVLIFLQGLLAK